MYSKQQQKLVIDIQGQFKIKQILIKHCGKKHKRHIIQFNIEIINPIQGIKEHKHKIQLVIIQHKDSIIDNIIFRGLHKQQIQQ